MKVSVQWLKRLVDLPQDIAEIERKLTALGLEVEGREEPGRVYQSIIVAKVLRCEKHPDSDHLSVTRVFDGKEELQVVCGAPNVAAGQTVCFAPIGTELPLPDGGTLKIKKAKIRGVESFGMICAEDEIGLGDSHEGILVLPDHLEAGTLLWELGYYDTVLEVNVTPNRPDALSHLGIARELAAAFGKTLRQPRFELRESVTRAAERIGLRVEPDCGCTRYVGRVIEGVRVGPSPEWLRRLLRAVGITPVNNVVDVTNFVLMELGQPLHSFDLDKLQGKEVIVRRARAGETVTAIDHKEYALRSEDLVICDGERPACIAGVMGGAESEIGEATRRVFLESAWFEPVVVRKQSKRLGLSTDSSYRFERHIDPLMQDFASRYACALIQELAGGEVLSGTVEFTAASHPREERRVALRVSRIPRVLGISPSADQVRAWLTAIGLSEDSAHSGESRQNADELIFAVPGFRPDLEREIDLIEEVARLAGYDAIPYEMPRLVAEINELPALEELGRKVRYTLAALGLHECLSLRFSSRQLIRQIFGNERDDDPRTRPVALLNPLSEDLGVLPVSLIPGLLRSAAENEKYRPLGIRLFEIAKAFFPSERREKGDTGYCEKPLLAGLISGQWDMRVLSERPAVVGFSELKGLLEVLLRRLRVTAEFRAESSESWLHPYRQTGIYSQGVRLGVCGELHPRVQESLDLSWATYLFEIDFQALANAVNPAPKFTPFSRQVTTTRDISMEVDERLTHEQIMKRIAAIPVKYLAEVRLKSIYQGEKIAPGKKNLVYQFIYQAPDRTLTDEEVNKAHERLRERLAQDGQIAYR